MIEMSLVENSLPVQGAMKEGEEEADTAREGSHSNNNDVIGLRNAKASHVPLWVWKG